MPHSLEGEHDHSPPKINWAFEVGKALWLLFLEIFCSPWRVANYVAPGGSYRWRTKWSSFDWFCFIVLCALSVTLTFAIYDWFRHVVGVWWVVGALAGEVVCCMICSLVIELADERHDDQ